MNENSLIDKGQQAAEAVWEIDTPKLNTLSIEERFEYITAIKTGLYAQFPAPENDPSAEIDQSLIPARSLGVLHRLVNSLSLSDEYHNFIVAITKEAADDFASNALYVRQLLNWESLAEEQKLSLVQEFHNSVIYGAKLAFEKNRANFGLSHSFKPLTVQDFYNEPTAQEDGYETVMNGYAGLDHKEWPGAEVIAVNTHERASFESAEEAIETIAHESAHVIEGFLAFTFGHHAPFIPDKFIADAKLLYHMYDKDAYVMGRVPTAYKQQANEVVARKAGETARDIISNAMRMQLNS